MNSPKLLSCYTRFNECFTSMLISKHFTLKCKPSTSKYQFVKELPLRWLLVLCVLLLINSAVAADTPNKMITIPSSLVSADQGVSLIIVDRSGEQIESFLAGVRGDVHLLVLEENQEPFEQINQLLA